MQLVDQVCSLELSKRLKELGVKQESLFCWTTELDLEFLPTRLRNPNICVAAFTVAELGEMLPERHRTHKEKDCWYVTTHHCLRCDGHDHLWSDKNEANARAKMLIYLIENKLMEVPQ